MENDQFAHLPERTRRELDRAAQILSLICKNGEKYVSLSSAPS
ncbi:hypothetical protein ABIA22_004799 [Sinorhizobium fredii]